MRFFWALLNRDPSHLIDLFGEIDDLAELIYLIDTVNLIDSEILAAYV